MTLNNIADITAIIATVLSIGSGYWKLATAVKLLDYRISILEDKGQS